MTDRDKYSNLLLRGINNSLVIKAPDRSSYLRFNGVICILSTVLIILTSLNPGNTLSHGGQWRQIHVSSIIFCWYRDNIIDNFCKQLIQFIKVVNDNVLVLVSRLVSIWEMPCPLVDNGVKFMFPPSFSVGTETI